MINATVIDITATIEWGVPHSVVPQHFRIYTNDIYPKWNETSLILDTSDDVRIMVSADYTTQKDGVKLESIQVFVSEGNRVAVVNNRKDRPTVDRDTINKNLLKEGNHRFFYGQKNKVDRSLTIVILKEDSNEIEF